MLSSVEGAVFRLTSRQRVMIIALASLPLAGGVYTLRRPQWFTGGTTWTCLSGLLIVLALSAIGDQTRVDASGVSVRRFFVYRRFVPWRLVDALYLAAAPMHRDGRVIAMRLVTGDRIALPAPLNLHVAPDAQYSAKVETLLTFARAAVPGAHRGGHPGRRDRGGRVRPPRAASVFASWPKSDGWSVGRRVLCALLAVASLVGVAGSINSLHYNQRNAAAFESAPPCAVGFVPPLDSPDPWCSVAVMTVQSILATPGHASFGFSVGQEATGADPFPAADTAAVVFGGHVPILDEISVDDVVHDVIVRGDRVGALVYDGQRVETFDSPILEVTRSVQSISTASSLAVLFAWLTFRRTRKARRALADAAFTGLAGYALVSLFLTIARSDNPGVQVLPFFAIAIGCARLVWSMYPIVSAPAPGGEGDVLWRRGAA